MTDRKAKQRRLERAGYTHVSGWLNNKYAARVIDQIEMHREDVAKIADEPAKPRGRMASIDSSFVDEAGRP
jgi:hypothetical protein